MIHKIPVRIYYEDTDAGGITYHASYIRFCERGRTEYLREIGFKNSDIHKDYGLLFVVRHLDADYMAPSTLDQLLELETSVEMLKNTSFIMRHCIRREGDPKIIFDMKVVVACINTDGKPTKIPQDIRNALAP